MKYLLVLFGLMAFTHQTQANGKMTTYLLDFSIIAKDCNTAEELYKTRMTEVREILGFEGLFISSVERTFCRDDSQMYQVSPPKDSVVTVTKHQVTLSDLSASAVRVDGKLRVKYFPSIKTEKTILKD